jgi:sodium/proline symporter
MDLIAFAWAGLGATFGASVIMSLYWKRCTRNGIVFGMLAGGITAILWRFFHFHTFINEIIPGFVASFIAIYLRSIYDKHPSAGILHEFEKVRELALMHDLGKVPEGAITPDLG